jgi:hypothetical protein
LKKRCNKEVHFVLFIPRSEISNSLVFTTTKNNQNMTTKEIVMDLGPGRTVFLIKDAEISAWDLVGRHPKYPHIYYLAKHHSVDTTMTLKLDSRESLHWEVDYDAAKEAMWNQLMRKVQAINWSFMDDKKKFEF